MRRYLILSLSLLATAPALADDDTALPSDKRELVIACTAYTMAEEQYHTAAKAGKVDAARAKRAGIDWVGEARKIGGDNWQSDVGTAVLISAADSDDIFAAKLNRCIALAGE